MNCFHASGDPLPALETSVAEIRAIMERHADFARRAELGDDERASVQELDERVELTLCSERHAVMRSSSEIRLHCTTDDFTSALRLR